jgi:hypothetical protein
MNWDIIGTYAPYVISAVSLYFALRKQKHEENGIDANAIKTFAETTGIVGKQYKDLLKEFNSYKARTDQAMGKLQAQQADLVQKNTSLNLNFLTEQAERKKLEKKVIKLETENRILSDSNKDLKAINISQANTIKSLTRWVEKLCNQLKDNNITPVPCDDK